MQNAAPPPAPTPPVATRPAGRDRARLLVLGVLAALAAAVVLAQVGPVLAQVVDPPRSVVRGTVVNDMDGDGARGGRERGIAGVSVSDGVTIVRTDRQGRYELEIDPTRRVTDMVFVTQPAGWSVGTDQYKTPRFYRDLGALDDGDAVTADFTLTRDAAGRPGQDFRFGNVADPHRNPDMQQQMAEVSSTAEGIDFIQVSGDLTNNASDGEFAVYRAGTAASSVPVWPAVGNHEYFFAGGTSYAARIDNYRRHVGPEWYSFDHGDRHFIVLENNGGAPLEEQYEWARQDLAAHGEGKQVVVLVHQPMNVPFGGSSTYDRFGDLLEDYDTELILVGHEHANDADTDPEWVEGAKHVQTTSSSYSIDHSPRGFRYVDMRGDEFTNPFRMYGLDRSLTVTHPAPDATVPAARADEVQVNAYDSADEVRQVRYRMDGAGTWRPLEPSGKFTWHAALGAAAPIGRHTMEVEAVDAAGARWTTSSTFTVTGERPVAAAAGTDWNQSHGDAAHGGVSPDVVGPAMQLAWSHRTDGTFVTGSPVIADGVAYAGTRDEDGEGDARVHAVDLATGDALWEYEVDSSIHGTPAVADGIVYAGSLRGVLYALDAETGELLWDRPVEDAPGPEHQRVYGYYSPAVADGTVYWAYQTRFGPASSGLLVALDPATGESRWEAPLAGSTMSDGTPAVHDGRVYIGSQTADRVLAFDVATGARLWQSSAVLGGWQDAAPMAADGRVFIGSGNGVIARDAETGADLWTYRSTGPSQVPGNATPSVPAVHEGSLYMGFPDGRVTALTADGGQVLWSTRLPGQPYRDGVLSSPAVSGDTLFVGSNNGTVYGLDRLTGQPLWEYEIGTWVSSSPALSGNTMVVGGYDGNLYGFTPGGEAAGRFPRLTGTVTDGATGAPIPGARVTAQPATGDALVTTTGADGTYVLGLPPGTTYTVTTGGRGFLADEAGSGTVEARPGEDATLDLAVTRITGPVAGTSTILPDFGSGSPRLDVLAGDTYHYVANPLVRASIVSRVAANNQPGVFQPGGLGDLALQDGTALETIDWSEMILSETTNDPARPWGRDGEWLTLPDITVESDTVTASGYAQIDEALEASVSYRALDDAPVIKLTLELTNTGAEDFDGAFQYLLDPDSAQDVARVPGVGGDNPGYVTSGWTGNHVYVGPTSVRQSPAHGVAWAEDQPIGISAFGYITGAWFDASVAAGETRTISWYHVTDYPSAGADPTAAVAGWAGQLDLLDDDVPDRPRGGGAVTLADTGAPAAGVTVEALRDGTVAATARTGADGRYLLPLEPGDYTVRATALGYDTASAPLTVTDQGTATTDLALQPVRAAAGTGKVVPGGLAEAGPSGIVLENSRLAVALATTFNDPQLSGSTAGKPLDVAVRGGQDQIDWINLPAVSRTEPTGTEAWQVRTVRTDDVEVVTASGEQAVVRTSGVWTEDESLEVDTTYTVREDEEWVTAETVLTNTGAAAQTVWVGDAIDHDGAGQRSLVPGHGTIRTPYAEPGAYQPSAPWIGMTGDDGQSFGLVYAAGTVFEAYGNGNWIMSRQQVEIPAGGSFSLTRRIVATRGDLEEVAGR